MTKKCDVLYIHSTKNPTTNGDLKYAVMPMGIIGILNNLKSRNINVLGLNCAIEKTLDPQFDISTALKDIEYKVLMTDLHWYEHAFGAMYIVEQSKKIHPDIPTVIGGYSSTIFSHEIMENFKCVDYIVTGDSDLPMELLTDNLLGRNDISLDTIPNLVYRQHSHIIESKNTWTQTDLDGIDFIHTDFFEHSDLVKNLCVSGANRKLTQHWLCIARGCKFNCSYCCGANKNMKALFRRCNVLTRSPQKVASDFCELTTMGITQISPSHDFQMFGEDYYHTIFSEIRKSNIKPGMYLECFQLPTKDYIDDIAKTFDKKKLLLVISPISGNEKLRKENGKFFTNDDLYETIKYIITNGIRVQLYYTLNVVGETEEEFNDTYFQMAYIHMMFGLGKKELLYQRIVIDPLAGMRDLDNIQVQYNTFMDYYHYCQLPSDKKYASTGFNDNGEIPLEKKLQMYDSLFN